METTTIGDSIAKAAPENCCEIYGETELFDRCLPAHASRGYCKPSAEDAVWLTLKESLVARALRRRPQPASSKAARLHQTLRAPRQNSAALAAD
jgi:hypothetical protein